MRKVALFTLCFIVTYRTLNNVSKSNILTTKPNILIEMKLKDTKLIGTFNCQGLVTSEAKQRMLADDFESKNIDILAVQETHFQGTGVKELLSFNNKKYKLYYSGNSNQSINGVGFIVHSDRKVDFEPISERICKISTKINDSITLEAISAYAPTLEVSETKPEVRDAFYAELDSVIRKSKSRNALIIAGDMNAKTGSAFQVGAYRNVIGKFGKGDLNSNGTHLLNFAKLHKLKLVNTFFKHQPAHITTWTEPDHKNIRQDAKSKTVRRNPYRNQIDYICTVSDYRGLHISDARSYGGMQTPSDHKLVMMNCNFKWPFTKRAKSTNCKIDCEKFRDSAVRQQYHDAVDALLKPSSPTATNQERWDNIVQTTLTAAKQTVGVKNKLKKSTSQPIIKLSTEQKNFKLQIDNCKDVNTRQYLRRERNARLTRIHQLLLHEERCRIEEKIKLIENQKNDSSRMFSVIREIYREKPKAPLLIDTGKGTLTGNPSEQCIIIAEHFKKQFLKDVEQVKASNPQAMSQPFTSDEIRTAIMKLKNNKSAGLD